MNAPSFPHRLDSDGIYHSICIKCLATVATAKVESDLSVAEQEHICEPFSLNGFTRFLKSAGSRNVELEKSDPPTAREDTGGACLPLKK
jgi:hypothetical protein